ncbi:MAG: Holliday junction resolvase RuvX [Coxiellaceae bacterium]|jgi:putative Holliday junction resolvase|nr:Holliday junction resolvase RuvX [Coxiellaceae bacterium]
MTQKTLFLAFDYGTSNIGVAIGQNITKSATALSPLVSNCKIPPWNKIDDLINDWQPQALVVGIPYKINGNNLTTTKLAQNFVLQLKRHYNLPVYTAAEHLTTKIARTEIFKQGGYRALQKESIDSVAARIILEEWLNTID